MINFGLILTADLREIQANYCSQPKPVKRTALERSDRFSILPSWLLVVVSLDS